MVRVRLGAPEKEEKVMKNPKCVLLTMFLVLGCVASIFAQENISIASLRDIAVKRLKPLAVKSGHHLDEQFAYFSFPTTDVLNLVFGQDLDRDDYIIPFINYHKYKLHYKLESLIDGRTLEGSCDYFTAFNREDHICIKYDIDNCTHNEIFFQRTEGAITNQIGSQISRLFFGQNLVVVTGHIHFN